MEKKYIIVDSMWPIIFPAYITHIEAAKVAEGKKITSAGFFNVNRDGDGTFEISTYGESTSLKLKPDEDDSFLIKFLFK